MLENTPTIQWVRYKGYSGCRIDGTVPVPRPETLSHMERAYFLATQLESPCYGAVQSYDGTGLSAGPFHHVAIYPKTLGQGSLFSLLSRMELGQPATPSMLSLLSAYRSRGWAITAAGILNNFRSGKPISGSAILNEFAPIKGAVPKKGPLWEKAQRWAYLHHRVFADPTMFEIQKNFAIDWLISGQKATEAAAYSDRDMRTLMVEKDLSLAEDLALCTYHAFSVNAPGPAQEILNGALRQASRANVPGRILDGFSRSLFGNWKSRYLRTRSAAMSAGLWPTSFFAGPSAIFPLRAAVTGSGPVA